MLALRGKCAGPSGGIALGIEGSNRGFGFVVHGLGFLEVAYSCQLLFEPACAAKGHELGREGREELGLECAGDYRRTSHKILSTRCVVELLMTEVFARGGNRSPKKPHRRRDLENKRKKDFSPRICAGNKVSLVVWGATEQ